MQFGTETGMQFTQPVETAEIWDQFKGNYKRNAFIPNGISGNNLDLTINPIGISLIGAEIPISDNNQIFIHNSGNLFAISLDGSSINWSQTPTAGETFENRAPGLVGDVIFMVESTDFPDIRFVSYDKFTGDEIDSRILEVGEQGFDELYIIQNELLYQKAASSFASDYFTYDPFTLTQSELFSESEKTYNSIAHSDGSILAVDDDDRIDQYDFSGNFINTVLADVGGAAVSPDNNLLITSLSNDIAAFNVDTLTQEWVSSIGGNRAIDNDIVYGVDGQFLFRLDLSDGSLIEFIDTGIDNLLNIAVTSDTIYIITDEDIDNRLLGYNKDDFSQIFELVLDQTTNRRLCITESSIVTIDSELNKLSVIT